MYCSVLYCVAVYCIVFHCIVLYCIVLYFIVLYCIVSHCKILSDHRRIFQRSLVSASIDIDCDYLKLFFVVVVTLIRPFHVFDHRCCLASHRLTYCAIGCNDSRKCNRRRTESTEGRHLSAAVLSVVECSVPSKISVVYVFEWHSECQRPSIRVYEMTMSCWDIIVSFRVLRCFSLRCGSSWCLTAFFVSRMHCLNEYAYLHESVGCNYYVERY